MKVCFLGHKHINIDKNLIFLVKNSIYYKGDENMGLTDIINLVIRWAPTILFLFILTWDFLYGLCRGLRKSIILLVQAGVAATICIALFFVCTKSPVNTV